MSQRSLVRNEVMKNLSKETITIVHRGTVVDNLSNGKKSNHTTVLPRDHHIDPFLAQTTKVYLTKKARSTQNSKMSNKTLNYYRVFLYLAQIVRNNREKRSANLVYVQA